MQAIHSENVTWKSQQRGVREAEIFSASQGTEETRIDIIDVPAGSYIPAHRHSARREFITILLSAGAQIQIGERIFRPVAGQVFHREPGDVLAVTNDSHHPFQYSAVRFGYEASDVEILQEVEDEELRASPQENPEPRSLKSVDGAPTPGEDVEDKDAEGAAYEPVAHEAVEDATSSPDQVIHEVEKPVALEATVEMEAIETADDLDDEEEDEVETEEKPEMKSPKKTRDQSSKGKSSKSSRGKKKKS